MSDISDKMLWNLFVEGDKNAFSSLFKIYYSQLHNYGLRICSNAIITEDCLQNFFVYLHEHRKKLSTVDRIKPYLFISFRRALLKSLKNERKLTSIQVDIESTTIFEFSSEDLMVEQEFTKIKVHTLTQLINKLSVREREAIYLKYYSELTIKEISEVMNITYQSVLNTLQKAFTKLKSGIEEEQIKHVFQIN